MVHKSFAIRDVISVVGETHPRALHTRVAATATGPLGHYLTFLRLEAIASCMRLLGGG
jgi:hypothetical protein